MAHALQERWELCPILQQQQWGLAQSGWRSTVDVPQATLHKQPQVPCAHQRFGACALSYTPPLSAPPPSCVASLILCIDTMRLCL